MWLPYCSQTLQSRQIACLEKYADRLTDQNGLEQLNGDLPQFEIRNPQYLKKIQYRKHFLLNLSICGDYTSTLYKLFEILIRTRSQTIYSNSRLVIIQGT